jgi:hypothetical protein
MEPQFGHGPEFTSGSEQAQSLQLTLDMGVAPEFVIMGGKSMRLERSGKDTRKARARSDGHGCHAARSRPTRSVYNFMRWRMAPTP